MHPRADDGIRTRDPHLGKVMRYQLRYIRTRRARPKPVAKDDNSRPWRSSQIPCGKTRFRVKSPPHARVPPRYQPVVMPIRSRGSVGERPLHTRKVAGSIPAGTTTIDQAFELASNQWLRLEWFPSHVISAKSTSGRKLPPAQHKSVHELGELCGGSSPSRGDGVDAHRSHCGASQGLMTSRPAA